MFEPSFSGDFDVLSPPRVNKLICIIFMVVIFDFSLSILSDSTGTEHCEVSSALSNFA